MSTTFNDRTGDLWSLALDYETIHRIKTELDLNLLAVVEDDAKLLERLANDEVLLVDVISVAVSPQIQARNLSSAEFAKRLDGKVLDQAIGALIEGIANFSRPRKGAMLRKIWAKIQAAEDLAETKVMLYLDEIDFGQVIDQTLQQAKSRM